jgi:hypothetical protein
MVEKTSMRERPLLRDFATIFAQMWYRDFPLQGPSSVKAQAADWTTHIGIVVRSTADLMGLFTRFESGGRTDAILRDNKNEALALLEWESKRLDRGINEFDKLKESAKSKFRDISFACLICYTRSGASDYTNRATTVIDKWTKQWGAGLPPLLLVVIDFQLQQKHRQFTKMTIYWIKHGRRRTLREQPAYPWNVTGSRWA